MVIIWMLSAKIKEARGYLGAQWKRVLTNHPKVSRAVQTSVAVGVISYHTYTKHPQRARGEFIKVASNSAWFAHHSKKIPFLNKIDGEKFILGLAVTGMALNSPQMYNALMRGNMIERALTAVALGGFSIRMVPPVEKMFRHAAKQGWKKVISTKLSELKPIVWANERFRKLDRTVDHFVYNNAYSSKFFKHGPSALLGMNAVAHTVYSFVTSNWPGFASGLASLTGTGLMVAAEVGMKEKQQEPQSTIFDPIEPGEEETETDPLSSPDPLNPEVIMVEVPENVMVLRP